MQCIKDCPLNNIQLKNFKATINHENCIKCGHCLAVCPVKAISTDDYDMNEVQNYQKETFNVDANHLMNLMKFRRSTRQFKKQAVEQDKVLKIIEAGRFSPTGLNVQDVSYIVINNNLETLKNLTYESLKEKADYILSHPTPATEGLTKYAKIWLSSYLAFKSDPTKHDRIFFHAPLVILIVASNPLNGALAASNMELMINALNLGTCFNGFFQMALKDYDPLLNFLSLKDANQVVAALNIGYPNVSYKRTVPRKKATINWL